MSVCLPRQALDASANPYIALAALVTAGMVGLATGATLPDPLDVDPATLSAERAAELGVERLPTSLSEALEALFRDLGARHRCGECAEPGTGLLSPYVGSALQTAAFCSLPAFL